MDLPVEKHLNGDFAEAYLRYPQNYNPDISRCAEIKKMSVVFR